MTIAFQMVSLILLPFPSTDCFLWSNQNYSLKTHQIMSLCFSKPTDDFPLPSKMLYELFLTACLTLSSTSSSAAPTLISLPFSLHTCWSFCLECPSPDIYVACSFTIFKITCLRTVHLKFQLSSLSSFF